jgi:hypothetical protein
MQATRRVYIYLITLIALGMLVAGLVSLTQMVVDSLLPASVLPSSRLDAFSGSRASSALSLILIGGAFWAVHWWLAERAAHRDPTERASALRRLFLYAALGLGALVLTFAAFTIVESALRALLIDEARPRRILDIVDAVTVMIVVGLFWLYYRRISTSDRRVVPERGASATLRRWFVYVLCFVGLMMIVASVANLIEFALDTIAVPWDREASAFDSRRAAVAVMLALLVAGGALWLGAWTWSLHWLYADPTSDPDPERRSVLRKVYLYGVIGVACASTIWQLGGVLYELLRLVLGGLTEGGRTGLLSRVSDAAGVVVALGGCWAYHAAVVTRESRLGAEHGRQATVRRIYQYVVAFIGLATLAFAIGWSLGTLIGAAGGSGVSLDRDWLRDEVSFGLTLVLVGLPVWLIPWRRLQAETVDPAATRELIRRIYLFLAIGVSVIGILGSASYTTYQLIRVLFGDRWTVSMTSQLGMALGFGIVEAVVAIYHLGILRADAGVSRNASANGFADWAAIAVIHPPRGTERAELERRLRRAIGNESVIRWRVADVTLATTAVDGLDGLDGLEGLSRPME